MMKIPPRSALHLRRRGVGILAVALISASLSSCSHQSARERTSVAPADSRNQIVRLFADTIQLVGGKTWTMDLSSAQECTTASGAKEVQYKLTQIGPGTGDARSVVTKVKKLWESKGFPAEEATVDKGTVEQLLYPTDGTSATFEFDANENAMTLNGQSSCVPGDADDLNKNN